MNEKAFIEKFIDSRKNDFISDLSELVAIRSVKSEAEENMPFGKGSAAAINKMCCLFEKYGFKWKNLDNFAAYADLSDCESALDILAHADVVDEGDGWDTPPYVLTLKDDGCIYGRGVSDDKGPALAALYAMLAVKESGIKLTKNTRLIIGGDEETGSGADLKRYYSEFAPAPNTFSPDSAFPVYNTEKGSYKPAFTKVLTESDALPRVIAISGGNTINIVPDKAEAVIYGISEAECEKPIATNAEKLNVGYKITAAENKVSVEIFGKSAHASTPDAGTNSITALLYILSELPLADCDSTAAINALAKLIPHGDNCGKALGISISDEISGSLTAAFSIFRLDEKSVFGRIDMRVPIAANDTNCKIPCENKFRAFGFDINGNMSKAHHTPSDGVFVKTLLQSYEEYTGNKGECLSMGGGTYVHGIEGGVAFGAVMPDFAANAHGPNEKDNPDNLLTAAKIYADVIIRMCK